MSLFIIRPNFDYCELDLQPLDLEPHFPEQYQIEDIMGFSIQNSSLSAFWPNIKSGFLNTDNDCKRPNISLWMDGVLLFSPTAKVYAAGFLEGLGEFLPINIERETWFLFNCLTIVNPIGYGDDSGSIQFNQEAVSDKHIFKSMINRQLLLFCTEKFAKYLSEYEFKGVSLEHNIDDLISQNQKKIVLTSNRIR